MKTVYTQEPLPTEIDSTIFLAGPSPRDEDVGSWRRPQALQMLEDMNFKGTVFVPEWRMAPPAGTKLEYDTQVEWETAAMNMSDCILFWIPRELKTMPAFTTNDEWGTWKQSGKVVFGAPENAEKVKYQQWWAGKLGLPIHTTLWDTLGDAVHKIDPPAHRVGVECQIPLMVWLTRNFQEWYQRLKTSGNRLEAARLVLSIGNLWGLHINTSEVPLGLVLGRYL